MRAPVRVEMFLDVSCPWCHGALETNRRLLDELAADPQVPPIAAAVALHAPAPDAPRGWAVARRVLRRRRDRRSATARRRAPGGAGLRASASACAWTSAATTTCTIRSPRIDCWPPSATTTATSSRRCGASRARCSTPTSCTASTSPTTPRCAARSSGPGSCCRCRIWERSGSRRRAPRRDARRPRPRARGRARRRSAHGRGRHDRADVDRSGRGTAPAARCDRAATA